MENELKQRKARKSEYKVISERFTEIPQRFHSAVPKEIRNAVQSKVKCFNDKSKREGHFSRLRLVTLIDPTLTESQKVLFSIYESLAYRFEIVNPSYDYLADILSVSPKTIQRNTRKHVEHGLLYLIKRQNKSNIFLVADVDYVYEDFSKLGVGNPSKLKWAQVQNFMDVLRTYFKDRFSRNSGNKKILNEDVSVLTEGTRRSVDKEEGMVEEKYVEQMMKDISRPFSGTENDGDYTLLEYRANFFDNLAGSIEESSSFHHGGSYKA